jgi:hypothetical protein
MSTPPSVDHEHDATARTVNDSAQVQLFSDISARFNQDLGDWLAIGVSLVSHHGQVGIAGHLTIGNNVRLQAQSGVARNIKDDEILQGTPSLGYTDFNKSYVHFKNLPKIVAEVEELKKQIINPKNGNNG